MSSSERWLAVLLRVGGVLTGLALLAVFLPVEWMSSIHRDLGLGEFPAVPITDYLTRSLSGMYAFHGALLMALSTDVRRYRPVITVVGWATAFLGLALLVIDLRAPMPAWWTLGEGPWVIVIGLMVVGLCRRLRKEESGASERPYDPVGLVS